MRCFFVKNGHIRAAEVLPAVPDHLAIAKARQLFEVKAPLFDAFEVWDGERVVYKSPTSVDDPSKPHPPVWPDGVAAS